MSAISDYIVLIDAGQTSMSQAHTSVVPTESSSTKSAEV